MAQMVLVIGESGTGKSTSLRKCDPTITAVVNPVGKPLPFKNHFEMLNNVTDARKICKYMREQAAAGKKLIAVDDFQYILAVPYMDRIKETGWDKFNDFGANYFEILEVCKELPDDVIVAYYSHLETLDNGLTTVKLIGKLLREKITIEGLFTVVLRTGVAEAKYYFYTQNSGKDTVKSPIGMFPAYAIDNDMNYVADKIRNYYEVGEYKPDDELAKADAAVAADIEKPTGGRKGRGKTTTKETPPTAASETPQTEVSAESSEGATGGRRSRGSRNNTDKSHDEVVSENNQKMADYQEKVDAVIDKAAGDRKEIPFDEVSEVIENIPKPELETPPRRTRKERTATKETVTLEEDAYFHRLADNNYIKKHKGDTVDLIVGGEKVMEQITKEEFDEGVKKLAQAGNKAEAAPAMNPPETDTATESTRTRRTRRTR